MKNYITPSHTWHHKLRVRYFVETGQPGLLFCPVGFLGYWIETFIAVLRSLFISNIKGPK